VEVIEIIGVRYRKLCDPGAWGRLKIIGPRRSQADWARQTRLEPPPQEAARDNVAREREVRGRMEVECE